MAYFVHYNLKLLNPRFDSELFDALDQLGGLRNLQLRGDMPSLWFFQLKEIFHWLESLGSARIEGNHTTLADYIEIKLDDPLRKQDDNIQEIINIESAMQFAEDHILNGNSINNFFIRELHAIIVNGLVREGDLTPGAYRQKSIAISQAEHLPPNPIQVSSYMEELLNFINRIDSPKYDLMKVALAHHRFAWIHPFNNGNGRVVRLLTYALLVKYGFNVNVGGNRILNPTAVFCNDRTLYYSMLAKADTGTEESLENWCAYVLKGFYTELNKITKLTRHEYMAKKILIPAILFAREKGLINGEEGIILSFAITRKEFKLGDLLPIFPKMKSHQLTYLIKKLLKQKMLRNLKEKGRTYTINFETSHLLRGVIKKLVEENLIVV